MHISCMDVCQIADKHSMMNLRSKVLKCNHKNPGGSGRVMYELLANIHIRTFKNVYIK